MVQVIRLSIKSKDGSTRDVHFMGPPIVPGDTPEEIKRNWEALKKKPLEEVIDFSRFAIFNPENPADYNKSAPLQDLAEGLEDLKTSMG